KPIIALTAHAMNEERARTREAGCNGHLTKPLNQLELIETIELHVLQS
ncbi:MAG: response regulator, partial [Proteobacteria bacterium]